MEEQQSAVTPEPADEVQAPADVQPSQPDLETEAQTVNETQAEEPQTQDQSQVETSEPAAGDEATAQAPAESPEPVEDSYQPVEVPQYQPPQFDLNQYADETGALDVNAANQAIVSNFDQAVQQSVSLATSQIRFEMQEQQEWNKAIDAHPELKKDASLRSMVHQLRAGSVVENNGKNYLSPKQAADKLFKLRGAAVQEGVKQAQTNTRVQESAYLETSDTTANATATRRNQLKQQMSAGNYKERQAASKELMKDLSSSILQNQLNQ